MSSSVTNEWRRRRDIATLLEVEAAAEPSGAEVVEAEASSKVGTEATETENRKVVADEVAGAGAEAPRLVDVDSERNAAALRGGQGSRRSSAGTGMVTPREHRCPSRRTP